MYGSLVDCLWFTPCSVLWTSRRSRSVPTEYSWRLLMTTWWITSELTKEYFSTLKDIQLFSTGSHCCAQLVSFWLRAMDSPWEPNCTQHDSTDRYAIGITEVIRPVHTVVFRIGQWCYLTTAHHWKSQWAQRSPNEGTNSTATTDHWEHVAHNGYCCSAMQSLSL